jgi:hypothetical protein
MKKKFNMKDGYQVTDEIVSELYNYDFHTNYIDSYTQMKEAEEANENIKQRLSELGVISFEINDMKYVCTK